MPRNIDILFERLKQFDEVTILELLDLTTEDILRKFKDRVIARREQLYGEIEIYDINDPEVDETNDYDDGYQIEEGDIEE
jgi:hypothetical protein